MQQTGRQGAVASALRAQGQRRSAQPCRCFARLVAAAATHARVQVRSICEDMPNHTGCDKCLPSWQKNATWGDCDLLATYGSVCSEMPGEEGGAACASCDCAAVVVSASRQAVSSHARRSCAVRRVLHLSQT